MLRITKNVTKPINIFQPASVTELKVRFYLAPRNGFTVFQFLKAQRQLAPSLHRPIFGLCSKFECLSKKILNDEKCKTWIYINKI